MGGVTTGEQIFLTHGTVGHVLAGLAVVVFKDESVNAHATVMTMPEVFLSTDSTESAISAVVGVVARVHPEIADAAVVGTELYAAIDAIVPERPKRE